MPDHEDFECEVCRFTPRATRLRMLYRYFRGGGIYQYEPKPRWKALRLAWAYWRKSAVWSRSR